MILWITAAPAHDGRDSNLAAVKAIREAQEAIDSENVDTPASCHEALKMIRDGQAFALAKFDDIDTDVLVRIGAKLNDAGMLYTLADEQPDVVQSDSSESDYGWEESAKVAIVVMHACGGIPGAAVKFLSMLSHAMPSAAEDFEDAIALIKAGMGHD